MKKILFVLILIVCCNGITEAGLSSTIYPSAKGYAIDNYREDGTFDRFFPYEDVRVGLPSWGEARGYVEFRIDSIKDVIFSTSDEDGTITEYKLDQIYLRRWWYSGSTANSNTSLYGYTGNGLANNSDVYNTDMLIKTGVGSYGSINVTDFVINLRNNNEIYAGFVLKEEKNGILLNYGAFFLDAKYTVVPEPTTLLLFAVGAICLERFSGKRKNIKRWG